MSVVGTPIGYTWSGKQFTDIFLKPIFQDAELKSLFRLVPGIVSSAKLAVDNDFEKILKAAPDCDETTTGSDIDLGSATLEVCELGFDRSQCFKDFNNTFREEFLKLDANYMSKDTYLENYLVDKFKQAIRRDILRIGLLGDTASGSADYNACDGVWKRVFDKVNTYDIDRVTITAATITNAGNSAVTAQALIEIFNTLYYDADVNLKGLPISEKVIMTTGSVHDALNKAYDVLKATNGYIDSLQKDMGQLTFKGIPITPIWRMDGYIENDLSNSRPNRILYYAKEAIVLGFDGESGSENVEILPNPYDKKVHMRGYMKMGNQILHDGLVRAAF